MRTVWDGTVTAAKVYAARRSCKFPAHRVLLKIFLCIAESIYRKKLVVSCPAPFRLPKQIPSIPAPLRHIKKVKGYDKHSKTYTQQPEILHLSTWHWTTWLKVGFAIVGFCIWGDKFAWAVLAYIYCYDIVRGVVRMALTFATLLGFIYFLFVHIL